MKRVFLICISVILALCLWGCNNPEAMVGQATICGVTNRCPVKIMIKVDGDGKILEAEIEEFLSIYDIGALDQTDEAWSKFGVEILDVVSGYSKYVRVGDKTFVFDNGVYLSGDLLSADTYDEYVKTNEGSKWYIDQVSNGNFDLIDRNGNNYGIAFNEYDDYKLDKTKWANKLDNGFHEGVEYDSGYKENIYKLIMHLKNHGFHGYTGNELPSGKQSTYKVGKFDTLVDLSNFHDYMSLAHRAYNEAKLNIAKQ